MLRRDPCVAADPNGQPQPGTVAHDGAMLQVAERRKRAAHPELSSGGPQRLLVLGSEIGGRWSWRAREPNGPRRHCEPQPPPPGRDGGGRLWPS